MGISEARRVQAATERERSYTFCEVWLMRGDRRGVGLNGAAVVVTVAMAFGLMILAGQVARGQSPEDNPLHTASRQELDVIKVILGQEKAWNAGDLAGYVKAYKDSPETLFIGHLVSKGYTEIASEYKHDYPTPASMGTFISSI